MDISLDSLVPFEKIEDDLNSVLQIVDEKGQVVLLKDNQPAYIIVKYETSNTLFEKPPKKKTSKYTLQEAMKIVLMEQPDELMHAAALADEVYKRGLYYKKSGEKAEYNQIRARASHYPDLFEALTGNFIKLKE